MNSQSTKNMFSACSCSSSNINLNSNNMGGGRWALGVAGVQNAKQH